MAQHQLSQNEKTVMTLLFQNNWIEVERVILPILQNNSFSTQDEKDTLCHSLGEAYLFMGRPNDAVKMLAKINPSSPDYNDLLYRCLIAEKEYELAISLITKQINEVGLSPCYFYDRAYCYANLGEVNEAFIDYCSECYLLEEEPLGGRPFEDFSLLDSYDRRRVILETIDYFSTCAVAPFSVYMLMGEVMIPSSSPLPYWEAIQLISDFLLLFSYQYIQSNYEKEYDPILLFHLGGPVSCFHLSDNIVSTMSPQSMYYYLRSMLCFSPQVQDDVETDSWVSLAIKEIQSRNKKEMKPIDLYYCGLFFYLVRQVDQAVSCFNLSRKKARNNLKKTKSAEDEMVAFYADKMHRYVTSHESRYPGYKGKPEITPVSIRIDEFGLTQFQWYLFENETLFMDNNKSMEPLAQIWELFFITNDDRKKMLEIVRAQRALELQDEIRESVLKTPAGESQIKNDDLGKYIERLKTKTNDTIEESVAQSIDAEYYSLSDISLMLEYLLSRGMISFEQWISLSLYAFRGEYEDQFIFSLIGMSLSAFSFIPNLLSAVISALFDSLGKDKSPNEYQEYKSHIHEVLNDVFYEKDEMLVFEGSHPSEETIKRLFHLRNK